MNNFCTLFDSRYVARALVMYRSLEATRADFTLYALCMDDASHLVVTTLNLPRLVALRLDDFETPRLLSVKASRTPGEYCWTCTPFLIADSLARYGLAEVTYLDADMRFHHSPASLLGAFRERGASVLITPHRYSPEYDYASSCGIYCVQFMTFRNDATAREVLAWWQDRCVEWCYARYEDGKFGDQKYLDDWPFRFDGIHVLQDIGAGVGPWNVQQYRLNDSPDGLLVDGVPLVFFHFHDYRYFADGTHDFGYYRLPRRVVELVYEPYARALVQAYAEIRAVHRGFGGGWLPARRGWKDRAHQARRWLRGVANRKRIV